MSKQVLMISSSKCVYCDQAKSLLTEYGYAYRDVDLYDPNKLDEVIAFTENYGNFQTVPQIVIEDQIVGGYEDLVKYLKENDQ